MKPTPRITVAVIFISLAMGVAYFYFLRPKTLPDQSRQLVGAMFRGDVRQIEGHFFASEVSSYNMNEQKRRVLKGIFGRCTGKVEFLEDMHPEVSMIAGQGAIFVRYRCRRTGTIYDGPVPSYLTPDGVSTGLLDDLITVWLMEYRNDFGEPPPGKKLLYEAELNGLNQDADALRAVGLTQLSQDGLHFLDIDSFRQQLQLYHDRK